MKPTLFFTLFIFAISCWSLPGNAASQPLALTEQQQLGKLLFEDQNLSEPKGVSCASCHDPENAFQGNNLSRIKALAKGSRDEHFGTRNTPTLTYAMFTPAFHFEKETAEDGSIEYIPVGGLFHDGRARDLMAQVEGPMLNPQEMNAASKATIVANIAKAEYAPLVRKLYGEDIFERPDEAFEKIATAIAAFEGSNLFAPFSSKFDKMLQGKASFSSLEAKGFELFKDPEKGNCLACHVGDESSKEPTDWLFTDYTYDVFAAPRNAEIPENSESDHYDLGLCQSDLAKETIPEALDLTTLCGAFKVPTLRNIAKTAPYMHNGAFNTLKEVVDFYATRDTNPEKWYPVDHAGNIKKFDDLPAQYHDNINTQEAPYDKKPGEAPRLNEAEIDALVAFLKTLSDKAE